jgi:hypothetical protein
MKGCLLWITGSFWFFPGVFEAYRCILVAVICLRQQCTVALFRQHKQHVVFWLLKNDMSYNLPFYCFVISLEPMCCVLELFGWMFEFKMVELDV